MWPSTTKMATPTSSQDDIRRTFTGSSLVSARRHVKHSDPQYLDPSQSRLNWPDWIRSTSVFQASLLSTAKLPASPIRTSPASLTTSTSGHAVHAGHRDIFTWFIDHPSFYLRADHGIALLRGTPVLQDVSQAVTNFGQILQPLVHLLNLARDQLANVGAGATA